MVLQVKIMVAFWGGNLIKIISHYDHCGVACIVFLDEDDGYTAVSFEKFIKLCTCELYMNKK